MILQTREQFEAAGILIESMAANCARMAESLARMNAEGTPADPTWSRSRAKQLQDIAETLFWLAGRADRLRDLNQPIRRQSNYGGAS